MERETKTILRRHDEYESPFFFFFSFFFYTHRVIRTDVLDPFHADPRKPEFINSGERRERFAKWFSICTLNASGPHARQIFAACSIYIYIHTGETTRAGTYFIIPISRFYFPRGCPSCYSLSARLYEI